MLDGKKCEYNIPETKLFPATQPEAGQLSPSTWQVHNVNDPLEQRALMYFRERTAVDLTGFTSYTQTFWSSLIPGLSQTEPAVRHIVIALSTKHEALRSSPERAEEINPFCIRHHSLALQTLTRPSLFQNEEILLVSCIAFITFERFQDPGGTAGHYLEYIIAGLKILRERNKARPRVEESASFNLVDSFIEPMFFQIQLVLSMFCEPSRLIINDALQFQESSPRIPRTFANLESAREAFLRICFWRYILSHQGEAWSSTSPGFLRIKGLVAEWHRSLSSLESTLQSTDDDRKRLATVRQGAQVLVGAMLYSVREDVPTDYFGRPALVYLMMPSKIAIFTRINNDRKINLAGINGGLCPWPHAKRVSGPGGENFVVLELSIAEATA